MGSLDKKNDFTSGEFPWIPGGYSFKTLVEWELYQAREEGRDPEALAQLEQEYKTANDIRLLEILKHIPNIPVKPDFSFVEPNDLESIRSLRPTVKTRQFDVSYSEDFLFDRIYGAWLGRCAGCALGLPAERFRPKTRQLLIEYLTAISANEWPITYYLPGSSPSGIQIGVPKATREQLDSFPGDDDLMHTVLAQISLQTPENPLDFKTKDLASTWLKYMTYRFSAGGTAMLSYRNLIMRYTMWEIFSPKDDGSIDWNWVAYHNNPFRGDIDAAIRADSYGYAAPGMPELAASLSWQDARLSNVKNGIYCSMFYAAMIATAFATDDPIAIVEAGLGEIPATSQLYTAGKKVIEICKKYNFKSDRIFEVHDEIYKTFGDFDGGTANNMALIVSALLMGGNDFEKVITYTVMGGWDCDSTAATSGSIVGAMLGKKQLPDKWIKPLNDTFYGRVIDYHPIAISELAKRSVNIAMKVLLTRSKKYE